jgi:hypothetical protein
MDVMGVVMVDDIRKIANCLLGIATLLDKDGCTVEQAKDMLSYQSSELYGVIFALAEEGSEDGKFE